jgi:vesicle-fusing ATPase
MQLKVKAIAGYQNKIHFNPEDALNFSSPYVRITGSRSKYIYTHLVDESIPKGTIGIDDNARRDLFVAFNDSVQCDNYHVDLEKLCAVKIECNVSSLYKKNTVIKVDEEKFTQVLKKTLNGEIATTDQKFIVSFENQSIRVVITAVTTVVAPSDVIQHGVINNMTVWVFREIGDSTLKLIRNQEAMNDFFKVPSLDPLTLGIGGLNMEFINIVRRAFFSRIFPREIIKKLGIIHVKGILLYGPPGTGKTLMARTIARMLNCRELKIISGPEMFNKYVGETEANIRNLFASAEKEQKEQGDDSLLHIIVIDEIEALCRTRGSGGETSRVGDTAVDQMLAKIDGVDALNNVLIIGMTNRKDMIDDAILRPGRLEIHIEVGLPDEVGRLQILQIHTNQMSKTHCLGDDVNLEELAKTTKNYTGAELSRVVRDACSFAMGEKFDFNNFALTKNTTTDILVRQCHFKQALLEQPPAFGYDVKELSHYIPKKMVPYNQQFMKVQQELRSCIGQLLNSRLRNTMSVLVSGPVGCGKTALVCDTALGSGISYIKMINTDLLYRHLTEHSKMAKITAIIDDAKKIGDCVIILDGVENLLDYSPVGSRYSNGILQLLKHILHDRVSQNKTIILGTCRDVGLLQNFDLLSNFDQSLEMTNIQSLTEFQLAYKSLTRSEPDPTMYHEQGCSIKDVILLVDHIGVPAVPAVPSIPSVV